MANKFSTDNLREQVRALAQQDKRFTKKSSDSPGAVYSSVYCADVEFTPPSNWTAVVQGMDSKFYEVGFTVDDAGNVTLGDDSKVVQRKQTWEQVTAHATASEIVLGAAKELPTNLQWMPPGKQVVQPMGFPEPFEMTITPAIASAADRQLQEMLDAHAAGTAAEPYIDINHEDKVRAFLPKKISWGGDHPKTGGVRVEGKWTGGGAQAALNGEQNLVSPSWVLHKVTKAFIGIKRNLGGLVPASAFTSIQAFAKADSSNENQQHKNNMTKEEIASAVSDGLKPFVTRLETLEANAKSTTDITTRVKALEDGNSTMTVANAKKTVEEIGVRGGRIASQDTATIEFWTQAVAKDSKAVDALTKMSVNPAFVQIVNAGGGAGAGGTTTSEHEFVVRAKAYGETNKIASAVEAQAKFAGTTEGRELYKSYNESLAPRGRK